MSLSTGILGWALVVAVVGDHHIAFVDLFCQPGLGAALFLKYNFDAVHYLGLGHVLRSNTYL